MSNGAKAMDHRYDSMSYSDISETHLKHRMQMQMQQYQRQVEQSVFGLSPKLVFTGEEAKLVLNTIKPTSNKLLLLVEDLP